MDIERLINFLTAHTIDLSTTPGYYITILFLCLLVSCHDMKNKTIPNWLLASFAIFRIAFYLPPFNQPLSLEAIYGLLFGFFVIFIPAFLCNQPMGGDIKFSAVLGVYLGIGWLSLALVVSLVTFIMIGIVQKSLNKNNFNRKTTLPYGPFLGLGTICCGLVYIIP